MKNHFTLALPGILAIACVGLVSTACKRSEPDSTTPASPVAIQGEPIQKLAAPETNVPAVATVSPAPESEGSTGSLEIADVDSSDLADAALSAVASNQTSIAASPAVETATPEIIRSDDRDYLSVGFSQLASYTFEVTDDLLESKGDPAEMAARSNRMIPDNIKQLDKQTVALKGYMLPLKVEQGKVTEFLLMRDQSMCCFGTVPKINEWVSVKTLGSGMKPIMDQPVTIFGTLHVGEIRENGYLVGIYKMDGEKLAGPLDL